MEKIKTLQFMARFLKEHNGYVRNRQSDFSNRFDFKFDKKENYILVFNSKKGENLFLWSEFIVLADILGLSHYIAYDKYNLQEVVIRIY